MSPLPGSPQACEESSVCYKSQSQFPRISPPTFCFLLKHLLESIGTRTQTLSSRNPNLQPSSPSTKCSSGPPKQGQPCMRRGEVLRSSCKPVHMAHYLPPTWASSAPEQERHRTKHPRMRAEPSPGLCSCTNISTNFDDPRLKRRPRRSRIAHPHSQPSFLPRPCACVHGTPSAAPPLTNLGVHGLATQARPVPARVQPGSAAGRPR